MNYELSEIRYPSSDGVNTIYAELYTPSSGAPRAIVQLAHGMIDYVGRYKNLADYFTGEGFVFAGNHHLGHGRSASCDGDFGYFAKSSGIDYLLSDMHRLNKRLREDYPTLPIILMGHSMGSFLARLYVEKYPHTVDGVIIHGTAGPNPLLPFGKALAKLMKLFRGDRYRSELIKSLSIGAYEKKFPKEGEHAWLTRELSLVEGRSEDKFTSFNFTLSAYIDLFTMLTRVNKSEWFKKYPKTMKTLIISGDCDPVGDFGKGPDYVYKHLMIEGVEPLFFKSYEGARHELFNETNRYEVFAYLSEWISESIK